MFRFSICRFQPFTKFEEKNICLYFLRSVSERMQNWSTPCLHIKLKVLVSTDKKKKNDEKQVSMSQWYSRITHDFVLHVNSPKMKELVMSVLRLISKHFFFSAKFCHPQGKSISQLVILLNLDIAFFIGFYSIFIWWFAIFVD